MRHAGARGTPSDKPRDGGASPDLQMRGTAGHRRDSCLNHASPTGDALERAVILAPYGHTAFEFITTELGAQGTVLGGGRYDGLMGMMGGPELPAVGWAGGIERLSMLIAEPPAPSRSAHRRRKSPCRPVRQDQPDSG